MSSTSTSSARAQHPPKGRVERAHLTLQDRLVKELRLAGVSSIDEGNQFLGAFVEDYNERFGREPQSPHDAHRPMLPGAVLDDVFRWQVDRKLSRDLTLHYKRVTYVLEPTVEACAARGQRVRIYEDEEGHVSIRHGEVELAARAFPKVGAAGAGVTPGAIADNKLLAATLSHVREQQQIREHELLAKARTRRERRLRTESLEASGLEK